MSDLFSAVSPVLRLRQADSRISVNTAEQESEGCERKRGNGFERHFKDENHISGQG